MDSPVNCVYRHIHTVLIDLDRFYAGRKVTCRVEDTPHVPPGPLDHGLIQCFVNAVRDPQLWVNHHPVQLAEVLFQLPHPKHFHLDLHDVTTNSRRRLLW